MAYGSDQLMLNCTKCKEIKHESEFYAEPRNTKRNGKRTQCKACDYIKNVNYRNKPVQKRSKQRHVAFGAGLIDTGLHQVCMKNALKNRAMFVLSVKQIHLVEEVSFTQITTTIQTNQEVFYATTAMWHLVISKTIQRYFKQLLNILISIRRINNAFWF